jgi:hypothetical protein
MSQGEKIAAARVGGPKVSGIGALLDPAAGRSEGDKYRVDATDRVPQACQREDATVVAIYLTGIVGVCDN